MLSHPTSIVDNRGLIFLQRKEIGLRVFHGQCESWCGVVREKRGDARGSQVSGRKSGQEEINFFSVRE